MGEFLAALGLKLPVMISSIFGGFISLSFFEQKGPDGKPAPLPPRKKWVVAFGGSLIGMYGAGPIVDALANETATLSAQAQFRMEIGLGLFLALFGMSVVAALIRAVPEIINDVRKRIRGGQ